MSLSTGLFVSDRFSFRHVLGAMPDQRRKACVKAASSEKFRAAEICVRFMLVSARSCLATANWA